MKILSIFGTRPEAIKMAPLVIKLNNQPEIKHKVCVTAQHREMLDSVLQIFDIEPDFDLDIMKSNQTLHSLTSEIIEKTRDVYLNFTPDLVLVHGDTTTSFAAALSAFYCNIKVGHVEAGLRTGNILSPFPEEANRVLTGRLATYHFAPTSKNVDTLLKENVSAANVIKTGNTGIDALFLIKDKLSNTIPDLIDPAIKCAIESGKKIILITGHRRENFGQGFYEICDAIAQLAKMYPEIAFIYPVHLNPNVRGPVYEIISNIGNIHLIEPLSYLDFVFTMSKSYIILTDSGGVQEEAPGFGIPVLVMRDTTERPEAVEAGTVKLVGANKENIINNVKALLEDQDYYYSMSKTINPYGDGMAADRIVNFLLAKV